MKRHIESLTKRGGIRRKATGFRVRRESIYQATFNQACDAFLKSRGIADNYGWPEIRLAKP